MIGSREGAVGGVQAGSGLEVQDLGSRIRGS